ncbi:hypothetical protein R6V09_33590 [Streptomyces sp. W16]|uniref:hypothetical protein n=1 Tax=Streptomyces sp. W16 TaxID=3076631 RepID=UPI00295B7B7E|nr:hypothetical protein [Streptomyces sp. W16]MDV9175033.1 hypothetical protein [Streptomyces sp. W16]
MSKLRRHLMSGAGVASALTGLLLYSASPASAARAEAETLASDSYVDWAGSMYFESYGDHFGVCDNKADGAGVIGYWKVGASGTKHPIYDGNGAGNCEYESHNVSETSYVYIYVCLRDNGVVIDDTCSAWERQYAGSPL